MTLMKKILWAIAIILILSIGYYVISPLFISTQLNDADPLAEVIVEETASNNEENTTKNMTEELKAMENETIELDEPMPPSPSVTHEGTFIPNDHRVAGSAKIIDVNGEKILRFENFDTVNGPNLHIYLSTDMSDDDFIDLGEIKATTGNINYEIPADIDVETYDTVLVWCVPFGVLFSYAELS